MAKFTKQVIMLCFMEMLKTKSLDKITVKDLCERCEINRNTFYYYFGDIYEVLDSLFEMESKKVMQGVGEDTTFLEEYSRCASIILNNRQAIIHIYRSKSREVLQNYLEIVIKNVVRRFIEKEGTGYALTEVDLEYITYFYSYAIIGNTLHWIEEGLPPYREDLLQRISDSYEATVSDMIKDCIERQEKDI